MRLAILGLLGILTACNEVTSPVAPVPEGPTDWVGVNLCDDGWFMSDSSDRDSAVMVWCDKGDTTTVTTYWSQSYGDRNPDFKHASGGGEVVWLIGSDTLRVKTW